MLACHRHENFLDSNFPHFSSVDVVPCHILVYNFHNVIWNTWNGMDSSPLRHCLHCLSLCSRADYVCLLKEFKWKDLNSRVWNPLIRPLCERLWVRRAILELNFNISAHLLRRISFFILLLTNLIPFRRLKPIVKQRKGRNPLVIKCYHNRTPQTEASAEPEMSWNLIKCHVSTLCNAQFSHVRRRGGEIRPQRMKFDKIINHRNIILGGFDCVWKVEFQHQTNRNIHQQDNWFSFID